MLYITGASGFIGKAVCRKLEDKGIPYYPIPRLYSQAFDWTKTVVQEGSTCIHLAGENIIRNIESDPQAALQSAKLLAHELLAQNFLRIIFVSSAVLYGYQSTTPHKEDEAVEPWNAYAQVKLELEKLFLTKGHTVVRPSNVYGPGMSKANVLSEILRQLTLDSPELDLREPIQLESLTPVRDYIHVTDVASALIKLTEHNVFGVFNIGTGQPTSVQELCDRMLSICRAQRRIEARLSNAPLNWLTVNPEKIMKELDWQPQVSLELGLKDLLTATKLLSNK